MKFWILLIGFSVIACIFLIVALKLAEIKSKTFCRWCNKHTEPNFFGDCPHCGHFIRDENE